MAVKPITMTIEELKDLYTKLDLQRSKEPNNMKLSEAISKEANNMKLSEAIAELENGSAKTYEAYLGNGTRITLSRDGECLNFQKFNHEGTPYEQLSLSGHFSGDCRFGLDWRPVKTWVEWDVAIGEWSLGKKIYCEINGRRIDPDVEEFNITPRLIALGVWYVEE